MPSINYWLFFFYCEQIGMVFLDAKCGYLFFSSLLFFFQEPFFGGWRKREKKKRLIDASCSECVVPEWTFLVLLPFHPTNGILPYLSPLLLLLSCIFTEEVVATTTTTAAAAAAASNIHLG